MRIRWRSPAAVQRGIEKQKMDALGLRTAVQHEPSGLPCHILQASGNQETFQDKHKQEIGLHGDLVVQRSLPWTLDLVGVDGLHANKRGRGMRKSKYGTYYLARPKQYHKHLAAIRVSSPFADNHQGCSAALHPVLAVADPTRCACLCTSGPKVGGKRHAKQGCLEVAKQYSSSQHPPNYCISRMYSSHVLSQEGR